MAELNFGLLTPPGSQSIGNAFAQGMDQAAVARAQENQNALAQYTLSKAKREDQVKNQLLNDLRAAKTPDEQIQAYVNAGMGKEAVEMQGIGLRNTKTRNEILAQPGIQKKTELDNQEAKAKFFLSRLPTLSQNPDDAAIGRYLKEAVDAGVMSFEEANAKSADLLSKSLPERRLQMLQGGQSAKDALAALKPDIKEFSGGLYNVNEVDPNTGMPRFLSQRFAPLSTPAANLQAGVAVARAADEGIIPSGAAPAPGTPAAAPAQLGTPVTPTTFPRVAPQVQAGKNQDAKALLQQELVTEQTNLTAARQNLASQAAATDPNIRAFYEKQVKLHTNNIVTLNEEIASKTNNLRGAAAPPTAVVNNLSGAQTVNAMNAPSPREIREARAKGYAFNPDGTMSRISGGPADKTIVTRTPVQEVRFRKDLATDYTMVTATAQATQDLIDSITDVKNSPGLAGATGIPGALYSLPNSQAAAAQTNLANLKGKVTLLGKTLASTEGKIGPMAIQEWTIVRDMVAALDTAVSKGEKITLDEIGKIEFAAKNVAKRVQNKFEGQYGDELSNYPQFATVPEPKSRIKPAAIPQAAIDALNAGKGTTAQFDEQFGAGSAARVKGKK